MAQAPMPSLPIDRGRPGPGLLGHVLVSKYCDHLPLYRQAQIYEREGVDLDRATMADWVGKAAGLLRPLVDAIAAHVMAADKLHADDTPVPVLDPGRGRTKTGRLWVYLRDERPCAGPAPPAVLYRYSPDRKGEHPRAHLACFRGLLQADGYAGFDDLYAAKKGQPPAAVEVACWAHVRRKFYDFHQATRSPMAEDVLKRIATLYDVEDEARGLPADRRRLIRQEKAAPLINELAAVLDAMLPKLPGKSDLAAAIRYARTLWTALRRYLDDGRLEIDNNAAERQIRPLATRRSLCPSSSSVCKHCELVFQIDATRATCSRDRGDDPLVPKVGGADLVRGPRNDLLGGEDTVLDEAADLVVGDAELRGGFGHRQPFAVLLRGPVGMDAVHPPQRADTVRGPGLSLTGGHSHPVQRRGDVLVRPSRGHAPHHGEGLFGGAAAMLAGFRLADPQLRMLAASPMDRQDDFARRLVDVGDDVGDEGTQQPLAGAHRYAWRVPCGLEIVRQSGKVG
jgi:hypothetical protein